MKNACIEIVLLIPLQQLSNTKIFVQDAHDIAYYIIYVRSNLTITKNTRRKPTHL